MTSYEYDLEKALSIVSAAKQISADPTVGTVCTLRRKCKLTESYLRSLFVIFPSIKEEVTTNLKKNKYEAEYASTLKDKTTNFLEKNLVTIKSGIEKGYSFHDFDLCCGISYTLMKRYLPADLFAKIRQNSAVKNENCCFNRFAIPREKINL